LTEILSRYPNAAFAVISSQLQTLSLALWSSCKPINSANGHMLLCWFVVCCWAHLLFIQSCFGEAFSD